MKEVIFTEKAQKPEGMPYPARTIAPANMGFMVQIDAIAVIE